MIQRTSERVLRRVEKQTTQGLCIRATEKVSTAMASQMHVNMRTVVNNGVLERCQEVLALR
jgi:hypothetical protein